MITKANRTINGYTVQISERNHLASLADFLDADSKLIVFEIRYSLRADISTIILDTINKKMSAAEGLQWIQGRVDDYVNRCVISNYETE